ncbi:MAG TPA: mechanosensitive ion channel domain-containing protein [Candidatus Saccharimonadales bacterium]|nr:mechanosensitive ion channel domain-containing protein [Candidatus Saccharimonadales bacterium]
MLNGLIADLQKIIDGTIKSGHSVRNILVFIVACIFAYLLSALAAKLIIKVAQKIAVHSDTTSSEERSIRLRRVETYLSVAIAVVRAVIVGIIAYIALRLLIPKENTLATTIGAGTFFIVFANATIAPLLRDFTSGAKMIAERWFSVGDFIRVEPFWEVGGVVERVTLGSTKLRNLNGEVVWLHNQYIQGVKLTPRGVRTIAIDIFVRNPDLGRELVDDVCKTLPRGPMMLARPLRITEEEKLAAKLWRITLQGQTIPGREWLIEKFIAEALKDADEEQGQKRVIIYGPLVRYVDAVAEKRFKRAVRVAREQHGPTKKVQ